MGLNDQESSDLPQWPARVISNVRAILPMPLASDSSEMRLVGRKVLGVGVNKMGGVKGDSFGSSGTSTAPLSNKHDRGRRLPRAETKGRRASRK